jgi:hypothetical protein
MRMEPSEIVHRTHTIGSETRLRSHGTLCARDPRTGEDRRMFTIEQREAVCDRVLELGRRDPRVVAGAMVGSLAAEAGDAYSDLDLTFAVADEVSLADVLEDWTSTLAGELGGVRLVDLQRGRTWYRVLLLPDALQLDLSMTPAAVFRPAGPRFRLVFGDTAPGDETGAGPGDLFIATPAVPADVFGWGVIYALHARACIERGRRWQAEHYVGAVRDHALALACLRHRVVAVQARGYDDLPAEVLDALTAAHVGSLEPGGLRSALAAAVEFLLREGADARLRDAAAVSERIEELGVDPGVSSA